MWETYVKYAFPLLVLCVVVISAVRELKLIRKEPDPHKQAARKRKHMVALAVTYLLIVAVTIMILR